MSERPQSYSEIAPRIKTHEHPSHSERVSYIALDFMVDALRESPEDCQVLTADGITINDPDRLTGDSSKPDFAKDLMWGVHKPSDLMCVVADRFGDDRRTEAWAYRMIAKTEVLETDDRLAREAKWRLRETIHQEAEVLGMAKKVTPVTER